MAAGLFLLLAFTAGAASALVNDTAPSFGNKTIADQEWTRGEQITPVSMPRATGGNGSLVYAFACPLTSGLTYHVSSGGNTIRGTPTALLSETECTYTVTDSDDNRAASDSDKLTFTIEVVAPPDTAPSFGSQTILDQTWTKGTAIPWGRMPAATGGNGDLTYTLLPALPAGVTFNRSTREVYGTPTATQSATAYTYTVTDADGNTTASDAHTLTFTITVKEPDTAPSFGSETISNQEWVKDAAITSVTLPAATGGNGTLTYSLSPSPPAGVTFTASTRVLSGTPTATQSATTYTYTVTDSDSNTAASDKDTLTFTIAVAEPDTAPSFGSETIPNQEWVKDTAITSVTLPEATGGNGTLTYSLSPSLPAGVTFTASTRVLSGTPTATQSATTYTYTVTDADTNTAASDKDTLTFTIEVAAPDTAPSFGTETILNQEWVKDAAISSVTLPAATGGNGTLTYSLSPSLPAGVTFTASTRVLSGTPTATQSATTYTYTVTDSDSNTAASDKDTLTFTIEVKERALVLSATELSVAEGGNGTFTVALSTQPTAAVTVTVTSGDTAAATVSPASLSFTTTDYATSQTVTVTGVQDDDADNESPTVSLSASGGDYGSVSSSVSVTVTDDDTETPSEPADTPSFGASTILSQTWVKNTAITSLTLPAATGGDGDLTYALTGTLPAGVTFNASTRTLSGTPTKKQAATAHTYTATDEDGDAASLSFTSRVAGQASDNASFVSYAGVPSTMAVGSSATVTVRMRNDGTTTWTSSAGYELGSQRPPDNLTWGLNRASLASAVPPNATADFTFTITAPAQVGSYKFRWRMVLGTGVRFGAKTELRVVEVETDESPSFGTSMIASQTWFKNTAINSLALPAATGGNGDLTYALTGTLPAGVTFDASTRTLSGTPTAEQAATQYTYTATDTDGDAVSLSFTIEVETDESPSFGTSTILSQTWVKNTAISSLTLPAATGGNGDLTYALAGTLPAGVTFDASTRTLSGTPTAKQEAVEHTYTATDTDGDVASLSFTIRVAGQASDNATFVSYARVPSRIAAGSSATVTVRMRNDGTTTWTSSADYELGSQRPPDNTTWGLSRVSVPSDVAPNATADFTFTITAPETTGSYKFRWRMIRGTADWFGDKTELQTIDVEDPSFGDGTIEDQAWVVNVPIEALTLPEASGGAGALSYTLTPALPAGVTFTESTRMVSGTPTAVQAKTEYTYTATDTAGDTATISFEIGVAAAPADNAVFVSSSGVPSKIVAGGTATVTVTMKNTGTTTWTSSDDYELGSQSPSDNTTWGLSRVSVPSAVAPNGTAAFTFTITAPETTGNHTFAWRMVKDTAWFGADTGSVTITVEDPSFGDETIVDQTWVRDTAIEALTLPAASGGDGALTYALTPSLPDGVTFTASTRTLSGTPTALQAATKYTYTATDTAGDAATISFEIGVAATATDDAVVVSSSGVPSKMVAGGTATVTVTMKNTGTTTWTSSADYELGSQSPSDNDTWGLSRVSVPSDVAPKATVAFTFTITAPDATGSYVFAWRMVKDTAWFGAGTASVTITVEDPSFGDTTVADQTWVKDTVISSLTLPVATGGDGDLTYTLAGTLPAGVTFTGSTRTLSGTPTAVQAKTGYTYTATDEDGDTATLSFAITVNQASSSSSSSATALPPPAPTGVFDMFEYWLLPRGSAVKLQARLQDGRIAPAAGSSYLRSFWRGELWGRKLALLGEPAGRRFDIFEEVEDGLDYWGTFEGGAAGVEAHPSTSLDRPFRWMHRFMAVGDVVESPVTGRWLSSSRRNQESVLEATMRLEVVAHHASFEVPAVDGLAFEDVLEVRFWPDFEQAEAHDTFFLAPGYGAVYSRRSAVAAGGVVEWWVVEKALTPVTPSAPSVPWFDPFSPGWPKTAVVNGNMDDLAHGVEGEQVGIHEVPGWTADSSDAVVARPPSGLDAGSWSMLLRGSDGGGDGAPDAALTEDWIPVEGGTYQLSACMLRENAGDNVLVDFDDGKGRDADFADAHLVATATGAWECRAVTKCLPGSAGAVRIRVVRDGANLGDAWFDRIELKRIAACTEQPGVSPP